MKIFSVASATILGLLLAFGIGTLQAKENKLADLRSRLTKLKFENDSGDSMLYRLFVPKDYDAKKEYPIILFLHGVGENGTDNERQLKHPDALRFVSDEVQAKHPCLFVAPQNRQGLWPGKPSRLAMELLDALAKQYSIDSKRIYVTGLSSGGMGTFDCLIHRPKYFAAAVPICGACRTSQVAAIAQIPVWGFCGDKDGFRFHIRMRSLNEAVKEAGGTWKYTEYPGVRHNSWSRAYATKELPTWLFSQSRQEK